SWCEAQSDEGGILSILSANNGDSFGILWWIEEVARWPDEEIENFLEDALQAPLSDNVRLAFLRERFVGILKGEYTDADSHPAGCEIVISASDGRRASLCFFLSGYSFTGPRIECRGVYRSLNEFRAELRVQGALTDAAEVAAISDHTLLKAWRVAHG
ncbi:MAG: hypothetical protein ACREOG_08050, partial [Gemmatimonadaceae bacterium]